MDSYHKIVAVVQMNWARHPAKIAAAACCAAASRSRGLSRRGLQRRAGRPWRGGFDNGLSPICGRNLDAATSYLPSAFVSKHP